jgi:predicted outer membrane repeat protein
MTFINSKASDAARGGGAIYSNGGSLKIVNSKFDNNHIIANGPDVAGGAVYATLAYGPTYITNSTFDGNSGANGGAIGGIFTSYNIFNSVFNNNRATGLRSSGNSGNGGAVYDDGNSYDLNICGTNMSNNNASFLGGAIFYVANDVKGHISIDRSTFKNNPDVGDAPAPGILKKGAYLQTTVSNIKLTSSTFE